MKMNADVSPSTSNQQVRHEDQQQHENGDQELMMAIKNKDRDKDSATGDATGDNSSSTIVPQLSSITFSELQIAVKVLNAVGQLHPKYSKKRKRKNNNNNNNNNLQQKNSNNENGNNENGNNKDDDEEENDQQKTETKAEIKIETETNSGLATYQHPNLRPLRKSLHSAFELHKLQLYGGKSEDQHYKNRVANRTLKRQKMAERDTQKKYIADTMLRRGRVDKLNSLIGDCREEEEDKLNSLVAMAADNATAVASLEGGTCGNGNSNAIMQITIGKKGEKKKSFINECKSKLIPDGHVDTSHLTVTATATNNSNNKNNNDDDKEETMNDVQSDNHNHNIDDNKNDNNKQQQQQHEEKTLPKLRSCYVCKIRFRKLHPFYDQLCPPCASLNFQKRHQSTDLSSKVAIVTGSRVKIGYQTCLKLLRSNCTVVATTRFPNLAACNYRSEKDFDEWKHRLFIYGLDLRDVVGIECFVNFMKQKFGSTSGVDILINNACQTVRRPTGYYRPLVEREERLWAEGDGVHRSLLGGCLEFEAVRRNLLLEQRQKQNQGLLLGSSTGGGTTETTTSISDSGDEKTATSVSTAAVSSPSCMELSTPEKTAPTSEMVTSTSTALTAGSTSITPSSTESTIPAPFEKTGISHSTAMSQMVLLPDDVATSSTTLPPGLSDINGHQLDLRKTNSWLLKLDQVSTPEVIECFFINAIAPFILNSRLHALLKIIPDGSTDEGKRPDRYIINVSAMEGKFYRFKMPNHPHTNMAKASLNMMTRTSSEDLAKRHRIFMNSVDTGWINDENPLEKASKIAKTNHFQTPIDEIDAAARILDPIFVGVAMDQDEATEGNGKDEKNNSKEKKKTKGKDYGKFFKDYRESEW